MPEQINIRTEGAVEIIEFNNPPMNFISHVMLKELHEELLRLRKDKSIRSLVLTGGMKDSFITHYNVSELLEYNRMGDMTRGSFFAVRFVSWFLRKLHENEWLEQIVIKSVEKRPPVEQGVFYWSRCMDLLDTFPKPIIAAISGMSLGGGCEISLCCDFRFMARHPENLYRIGLPEVLVGIIPGGTGTHLRLPRVVGEAKALEILLTGKLYTPDEAEAMGLINKALSPEELMPTVMELAQKLARGAPIAIAAIRENVRRASRMSWHEGRAIDLAVTNRAVFTNDAAAGMARYVERLSELKSLELQKALNIAEDLRNGREVEYKGH